MQVRAMILEDNRQLSFVWQEALADLGAETVAVASVSDAMGHVLRGNFDLYILDLFLEDGNSLSLSDWIATRAPDVPILMLTGSQTMASGEHIDLARGVTWMLRKPVPVTDFKAYVEHLLAERTAKLLNRAS